LKRIWLTLVFFSLTTFAPAGPAQNLPNAGQTLVVFPFENVSGAPGLAWISESFPELLGERLSSPSFFVVGRDQRLQAYDRGSIPANLRPSRATLYRLAEQLDVDYVVLGKFSYDGRSFTSTAQLLDMRRLKLQPPITDTGPLTDLINVQTGLAWDLLRQLRSDLSVGREAYIASFPPVRLDAFENYIRGVVAATPAEKINHFRDAVRLNAAYNEAWLHLGETFYGEREYDQAIAALSHIPQTEPVAREASFYIGMSSYYVGDFSKAESAFSFVAARLPLAEVDNNLGVASARRGKKEAAQFFQRAVDDDPNDADYHFNLGVALYRNGDVNGALRQLRDALTQRPADSEAKSFLDRVEAEGSAKNQAAPGANAAKMPLERIKRNYDENSFRQVALQLQVAAEQRWAKADPHKHAQYHVSRGNELLGQGFVAEAEREFREAVTLDSSSALAHVGLAQVLEDNGDSNGARSEAETAFGLKQSAEPLLILVRLDLRENRTEAASESVDRALKLEPSNPSVQALKRAVAAKLAEKAQPLPNP
jgi:tetratricopeptide (TPR) repeat protein